VENDVLTVEELAQRLKVSPRTVWKRVAEGELPAPFTLGRLKRWRWSTILKWLEPLEEEAQRQQERRLLPHRG